MSRDSSPNNAPAVDCWANVIVDRNNQAPKEYLKELYENTPVFDELPMRYTDEERNLWQVMSQYLVGSLKDKHQ